MLKNFLLVVALAYLPYTAYADDRLIEAASAGNLKLVESLINEEFVDVNYISATRTTALIEAAKHGHVPVIDFLISKNAYTEISDGQATAAVHAYMNFQAKAFDTLLKLGAKYPFVKSEQLASAVSLCDAKKISQLLGEKVRTEYRLEGKSIAQIALVHNCAPAIIAFGKIPTAFYNLKKGSLGDEERLKALATALELKDLQLIHVIYSNLFEFDELKLSNEQMVWVGLSQYAFGGKLSELARFKPFFESSGFSDFTAAARVYGFARNIDEDSGLLPNYYYINCSTLRYALDSATLSKDMFKTVVYPAVYCKSPVTLDALANNGVDIKAHAGSSNSNVMYVAVGNQDIQMIKQLIKYGVSVDGSDVTYNPLKIAIQYSPFEIVKLLLESGATKYAAHLVSAIEYAKTEALELLLKSGYSPDMIDAGSAYEPIYTAIRYPNRLEVLLKAGANPNGVKKDADTTPLISAINNRYDESAKLLIKFGAKIDSVTKNGDSAIAKVLYRDVPELLEMLLAAGLSVNTRIVSSDNRPLLYELLYRNYYYLSRPDTVLKLVNMGADLTYTDAKSNTILHALAQYTRGGDTDVTKLALAAIKAGVSFDAKNSIGLTALVYAIHQNASNVVAALLSAGANPNVLMEKLNDNYLVMDSLTSRYNLLKQFLTNAKNLNINAKDEFGRTIIHHVVRNNADSEMVTLLASYGADLNAKNNGGYTALESAMKENYRSLVRALIRNKAAINTRTITGMTPLMYAASILDDELVTEVLSYGGDPTMRDFRGKGPKSYARATRRAECPSFLSADYYHCRPRARKIMHLIRQATRNWKGSHETPEESDEE